MTRARSLKLASRRVARPTIAELSLEATLHGAGYQYVAGVDEVGRGCWAGPVYAAAVVLPEECYTDRTLLGEVTDSKLLSPAKRERLAADVQRMALVATIGWVEAPAIDRLNILGATRLAMQLALQSLDGPRTVVDQFSGAVRLVGTGLTADFLVTDAVQLPEVAVPQSAVIRGDRCCLAVAAASIIAKVARDAEMCRRAALYPAFRLEQHKGYGTWRHARALQQLGLTPLHRRSFAPMKYLLGVRDHIAGSLPAAPVAAPLHASAAGTSEEGAGETQRMPNALAVTPVCRQSQRRSP